MNLKFFKENLKKLTIKVKLITIISIILLLSLGLVIFVATRAFRGETEVSIQLSNLQKVQLIADKVEREIQGQSNALRTLALTEETNPGSKVLFENEFFVDTPQALVIYFFFNGEEIPKVIRWNEKLLENANNKELAETTLATYKEEFQKTKSGNLSLINISPAMTEPYLALATPFGKEGSGSYAIMFFQADEFLKAFQTANVETTVLVDGKGDVIAHPESKVVVSNPSFAQNPMVSKMLTATTGNGQTRFLDTDNLAYLGTFQKLGLGGLGVVSTVPENKVYEAVYTMQRTNLYILMIVLSFSIIFVFFYSRTLTTPIQNLVAATKEIESGNFALTIKPKSGDEIGILTTSFVAMGKGLEEREKVKSILGSMIDPTVVEQAMIDFAALKRGSETEVTAFFSDVAGFSTISEQLQSADLAALLNEYLSAMTLILKEYDGVLDKYIGDAIVGIFNAPVPVESHALKAGRASLKMIKKLHELRDYWVKNNLYTKEAQEMDCRIGLNSGLAKVGFMGTDALASYTMMGDTVNLAARLEAAGKDYGVNILISENVKSHVQSELFTRDLDLVRVKGKNEPVKICELICENSEATPQIKEASSLYEKAFQQHLERDFKGALSTLEKADKVKFKKKDKAILMLQERIEEYLISPPPADWDGAFTRTHK